MGSENSTVQVKLEFIENHLPGLKSGSYTIEASQTITGNGIDTNNKFSIPKQNIEVRGERFSIKPSEIHSVFPPNNSLGEYSNVLPQIVLNRSTLPWERSICALPTENEKIIGAVPWMALLVFNEDELVKSDGKPPASKDEKMEAEFGEVMSLIDARKLIPSINKEPGERDDDLVKVIHVSQDILRSVLPKTIDGLSLLAHARQSRLAVQGSTSTSGSKIVIKKGSEEIHEEVLSAGDGPINAGILDAGTYSIRVVKNDKMVSEEGFKITPSDSIGSELAIVVANRLPAPGAKSIMHLVSLENRYNAGKSEFIYPTDLNGVVSLISLKSWSFSAVSEKQTFRNVVLHLNHQFLFGINLTDSNLSTPSVGGELPEEIKKGFLKGRRALSDSSIVLDIATQLEKDSKNNNKYYVGTKKPAVYYNLAGRLVNETPDTPSSLVLKGLHFWIEDGSKTYFVSEDLSPIDGNPTGRLGVYLLPKDSSPTLRIPDTDGANKDLVNGYYKMGFVPLPHSFRGGSKSVSWYRGPLLTGEPSNKIPLDQFPIDCSDELLRYHDKIGMFDASYAAAWELGRLMALKSKKISVDLYNWKRMNVQNIKALEQRELHPHLPFHKEDCSTLDLPENIEVWLSKLSILKGIPFNYLVPDERMLPIESIRFFYLDPSWIASLMDGALSIGRVNAQQEKDHTIQKLVDLSPEDKLSGCIIRSSVVAGWPNMQVTAYDIKTDGDIQSVIDKSTPLELLRAERLSANVLLCIFKGDATILDVHEHQESIHLGFDRKDEGTGYTKKFHKSDGAESETVTEITIEPEKDSENKTPFTVSNHRVVDVVGLRKKIIETKPDLGFLENNFTSAQFALAMIEGVENVRFIKKTVK